MGACESGTIDHVSPFFYALHNLLNVFDWSIYYEQLIITKTTLIPVMYKS